MIPNTYFESHPKSTEKDTAFALLPKDGEGLFEDVIAKATDGLEIKCSHNLNQETLDDPHIVILKNILQAEALFFDLTGLDPLVMYYLGVALTERESHHIVLLQRSETQLGNSFPFSFLEVRLCPTDPDEAFITKITQLVRNIQHRRSGFTENPKFKDLKIKGLLKNAEGAVSRGEWEMADMVFEKMDSLEPGHWYIVKQWGIMYREQGEYSKAEEKFDQAMEIALYDEEKAMIALERALLYQKSKRYTDAEAWFTRAEGYTGNNKNIYFAWAKFHDKLGDASKALIKINKILEFDNKDQTANFALKYYAEKAANPSFTMTFEEYKNFKRKEKAQSVRNANPRPSSTEPPPHMSNSEIDWDIDFETFRKRFDGKVVEGYVVNPHPHYGLYVQLSRDLKGKINKHDLPRDFMDRFSPKQPIKVKIEGTSVHDRYGTPLIFLKSA